MPLPKLPGFMADGWNEESCSENPLHLAATLACGQNFRWRHDTHGVWWSTIGELLVALWQHENRPNTPLYWQTYPVANQRNLVRDYLRLDFDLDGNASDGSRPNLVSRPSWMPTGGYASCVNPPKSVSSRSNVPRAILCRRSSVASTFSHVTTALRSPQTSSHPASLISKTRWIALRASTPSPPSTPSRMQARST